MQTELAREKMSHQQVRAWEVLVDRVIDLMGALPRERFVPPAWRALAYADTPVHLPHGQHMLQPSVAGRLLQALDVAAGDEVLEIGTGTGYVTACLARLGRHVRSLEIFDDLAASARANLTAVGARNVDVQTADASQFAESDRFDVIAVTASLPVYDVRFERALKVGGRLFVVVGSEPIMEARLVRRVSESEWTSVGLFETVIDPLVNARRPEPFVF